MKTENFERAKQIEKEIDKIIRNINSVSIYAFQEGEFRSGVGISMNKNGSSYTDLLPDFLVIPVKEFIGIYISRAQERIKELEKEFELL